MPKAAINARPGSRPTAQTVPVDERWAESLSDSRPLRSRGRCHGSNMTRFAPKETGIAYALTAVFARRGLRHPTLLLGEDRSRRALAAHRRAARRRTLIDLFTLPQQVKNVNARREV